MFGNQNRVNKILASAYVRILLIKFLSIVLLFLCNLLAARILTLEEFGGYALVTAIGMTLSLFTLYGGDKYAMKNLSILFQQNRVEKYFTLMAKLLFMVMVSVFVLSLLAYAFVQTEFSHFKQWEYVFMIAYSLVFSITRLLNVSIRCHSRVLMAELLINVVRPGVFIVLLLLSYVLSINGLSTTLTILLLSYGCILLVSAKYIQHNKDGNKVTDYVVWTTDLSEIRSMYGRCTFFFFVSLFGPLLSYLDILMIGALANKESVAIYSVVAKLTGLILVGLVSANMLIAPKISPLVAQGEFSKLQSVINKNNQFILFITILPVCVLLFLPMKVLGIYGEDYLIGAELVPILLVGQLIHVVSGPTIMVATQSGFQLSAAVIMGAGCLVSLLISYLLIPVYGVVGAAFANVLSYSFVNIGLNIYIFKKIGVDTSMIGLIRKNGG